MSDWKLPHLMAKALGGSQGDWRWVVEEGDGELVWALVQVGADGVEHRSGIFAVGENVPLAGKIFAAVTPSALREMSERALQMQECLERLERVSYTAERMRKRAYRLKNTYEYADLVSVTAELTVARKVLEAPEMPALAELERLEYEALAALRNPPPSP